jgi:hypothetical protein
MIALIAILIAVGMFAIVFWICVETNQSDRALENAKEATAGADAYLAAVNRVYRSPASSAPAASAPSSGPIAEKSPVIPDPAVPSPSARRAAVAPESTPTRTTAPVVPYTPKPPLPLYVTLARDITIPHGNTSTKISKGSKLLVVGRGAGIVLVRYGSGSETIPTSAVEFR